MNVNRILTLLLKYYYISINRLDRIFDIVWWPLLDILIWGFMTSYIEQITDFNIITSILGGVLMWIFVWRACQDMAVYVLEDYWSKNLYHLFSTPVTIPELITSLSILGIIRAILSFILMSIVAFFLYSFNILVINLWFMLLGVAVLLVFAWALGLVITASFFRFGSRIQVFAWSLIWIIQPFSCVFYPITALPLWAQKISYLFPTTHVFEAFRASLFQGVISYSELGFALFLSIVYLILASWVFLEAFKKAKESGSLARAE